MAFPDLDVSHPSAEEVKAFTDAATALEATANTVRTQRDEIQRGASGNAINVQTSVLTDIEQKIRDAATKTAKVAAAMKVLREAGDTWLKVAPKKAEIEAAEKEVETAREVMAMAERMGVPSGPPAEKFEAAKKKLREMLEKRKAADEAYSAACKKAAGMVSGTGGGTAGQGVVAEQGGGTGRTRPGGDSKPESGTPPGGPPPAAPSGPPTPAPRPAPGTPKPSTGGGTPSPSKPGGTPAATPSAEKPATSTSTPATPTSADQALAALLAQQRGQSSGAPATAGLPQQQTQQTKPAGDRSTDPGGGTRPIDSAALAAFLNQPPTTGDGSAPARVSTPSPSSTSPHSSGAGTAFRPDFTAPKPLGGGVLAQPAVTGTSVTGVQTGADVSGRSTPTPGAFTNPAGNAPTSTSGAHGGGPGEQTPTSSRPAGPGSTPMMGAPMMPPMGGGGGGGRGSKSPEDRGVLAENPLLDGSAAIEEAVKHGTIIRKDDS